MIYFIEHDEAGNIVHACADPMITIVPLINRVTFKDANGNYLKDANGNDLSPFNSKLLDPVAVGKTAYDSLIQGGLENYTADAAGNVTKRVAPSGN